ncbi:helix-turn-helix domain-containing protein [Prauserella cavernicola]|uniref:Helix-turn-helix domain-containing protein n=1 Tax=Prauserella cavernicola TaxID=2800127 RepID=A0A934QV83_9PSEU|nr:helix-turn-helix domain-containing protein [Prauserella cavernicola]MBK1787140.1 helix-turn-helix domain-containing protein [Prauserella cavernicola]
MKVHAAQGPGGTLVDTFEHWQELLDATYVRLLADRMSTGPFSGQLENVRCGEITLSTMAAGGQRVRRTRSLIRSADDEFLLATVLLAGSGRIEQDDRRARLAPGTIVFYDSARPYVVESDGPFRQLVVRVPKQLLPGLDTRTCTARPLGEGTPGAVVSAFLTSLSATARAGNDRIAPFASHVAALITTAATAAGQTERAVPPPSPLLERILEYLYANSSDHQLDVADVAAACHLSRRSLYRVLGADGLGARLRRIRIGRAQQMLLAAPSLPISVVANACGFASESGFHRAFRRATGQTPGQFRCNARHEIGTPGQ